MRPLIVAALCLVAVAAATAAPTPPTKSALLLTAADKTSSSNEVTFISCALAASPGYADSASLLSPIAEVGAKWWAPTTAATNSTAVPVRDFGVEGCSTVWLAGGRSVRVYGATPAGCKATWSAAPGPNAGALLTAAVPGSAPLWQLQLPADGRPARMTCAGFCPLVTNAEPCTPAQAGSLRLPSTAAGVQSFAKALVGADNSCAVGSPAPEDPSLSYGVAAQFFSNVFGEAECSTPTPWSWYGVPPFMEAGPGTEPQCVASVDFRSSGKPWSVEPPLDPALYSTCFGSAMAGWVKLPAAPIPTNASLASRFRVCARYTSQVEIIIAGSPVALASPDPRVDMTFACQDLELEMGSGRDESGGDAKNRVRRSGLVPLSIRYAATPIQDLAVAQLWVIPAVGVYENPEGGTDTAFACDACAPFSPLNSLCCPPLGSCAYRAVCGGGGPGGPSPSPSPPPPSTTEPAETTPSPTDPSETTPPASTPSDTTAPPTPPSTTPGGGYGGYGTTPPPGTTPGGYGTEPPPETTPPAPETTAPPATAPPTPPSTTPAGGGYGTQTPPGTYGTTPPPPPETTAPPPETTPPASTCAPDRLDAAARRDWAAFQSAAAAASGPDELQLLVELFA